MVVDWVVRIVVKTVVGLDDNACDVVERIVFDTVCDCEPPLCGLEVRLVQGRTECEGDAGDELDRVLVEEDATTLEGIPDPEVELEVAATCDEDNVMAVDGATTEEEAITEDEADEGEATAEDEAITGEADEDEADSEDEAIAEDETTAEDEADEAEVDRTVEEAVVDADVAAATGPMNLALSKRTLGSKMLAEGQ